MGIQMIQRSVCLLTTIPSTLVHALDFLVSPPWALVLLCSRDGHKRIDLFGPLVRRQQSRLKGDSPDLAGAAEAPTEAAGKRRDDPRESEVRRCAERSSPNPGAAVDSYSSASSRRLSRETGPDRMHTSDWDLLLMDLVGVGGQR